MHETTPDEEVPVVIAGGGPVGLLLGALLSAYNVPSVVLESDEGYCEGSRAICIARRSLEMLAWVGADRDVVNKGLGWISGRSFFRNREVLSFSMDHDPGGRFAPMVNLQQYYLEEFIHRALARQGLCELRWGCRVLGFEEDAQGVTVRYQHETTEHTVRGRWLVAADGARSTIRRQLKLPLLGTSYEGQHIIADVEQVSSRPLERLVWFDPPTNPAATVLMHRQPDHSWRIDFQVAEGDDVRELMRPERLQARIQSHLEMIGEFGPWRLKSVATYDAKCFTLENYRHGQVLFAGDAAHLVPVFGVRGLNSGLDDAGNLAWKLAWVLRGGASAALLDTYSLERVQAARDNLDRSAQTTEFMSPPTFAHAIMREATLRLALKEPRVRSLINPRSSSPVVYDGSILNQPDGVPEDGPLAAPGSPAPEITLMSNDSRAKLEDHYLSEAFGRGFVVLTLGADESLAALLSDIVMHTQGKSDLPGVAWLDVGVRPGRGQWYADAALLQQRYGAMQHRVYLLRPDGYVLGRWSRDRAELMLRALQVYYPSIAAYSFGRLPAGA